MGPCWRGVCNSTITIIISSTAFCVLVDTWLCVCAINLRCVGSRYLSWANYLHTVLVKSTQNPKPSPRSVARGSHSSEGSLRLMVVALFKVHPLELIMCMAVERNVSDDNSQVPLFVVLLLIPGRCYEAELCAILFLLRFALYGNLFCQSQNFQILAKNHGL